MKNRGFQLGEPHSAASLESEHLSSQAPSSSVLRMPKQTPLKSCPASRRAPVPWGGASSFSQEPTVVFLQRLFVLFLTCVPVCHLALAGTSTLPWSLCLLSNFRDENLFVSVWLIVSILPGSCFDFVPQYVALLSAAMDPSEDGVH